MTFRRSGIALSAILLAAFILRIWGLGFGLPFQAHQDEPIIVNHALAYGSGDLNPHFFYIPPLTSYLLFIVYGALFLAGLAAGAWGSAADLAAAFFADPSLFYIVGRFFIGVVPGTVCVFLTYRLALRLLGGKGALFAAAIMAFSFLNVVNSHYIYTDMLLTAAVISAVIALEGLYETPSAARHAACGALIGLAAGVKYNGAILVLPYLITHVLSVKREGALSRGRIFSAGPFLAGLTAAAAFIAVNPFAAITPGEFFRSFLEQSGAFWYTGPVHHFLYSLSEGISLPLASAGLIGLILISLGNDKGKIFISFPAVYYAVIALKSQHFSRYVLPIVPFFAIGAAFFLVQALPHFARSSALRKVFSVFAAVILLPTLVKAVKADMLFSSLDTRIVSARWIEENIPIGESIAFDSTVFRPALRQPASQLEEKRASAAAQRGLEEIKGRKLDFMIEAARARGDSHPLYFMFVDPAAQGQFLDTLPAVPFDSGRLKEEGIGFVVVNAQETNVTKEVFVGSLSHSAELLAEFSPYPDGVFRESLDRTDATCIPVRDEEIFSRKHPGPALRIYKLK